MAKKSGRSCICSLGLKIMGFRHFWGNPHYNIFSEARAAKKMGEILRGIDFSRPSPESKSGRGIHQNNRFGSGSMSPFREIAVLTMGFNAPQPESPTRISRAKAALNGPVTDRRASVLHATVPSSSGPARKHTAKFEPSSWSWAQMTSGSGAPKRVLSEEAITLKLQRPN